MDVQLADRITVTIEDACKLTGIGRKQLEKWIKTDINFPSFKIGTKTMIAVGPLRKYLETLALMRAGETVHSSRMVAITEKRAVKNVVQTQVLKMQ